MKTLLAQTPTISEEMVISDVPDCGYGCSDNAGAINPLVTISIVGLAIITLVLVTTIVVKRLRKKR